MIGRDVVRLVFYDSTTEDIIYFEEELQRINGNALNRMLALDKLDTHTIAGWRYKVMEPISFEVERIEKQEDVVQPLSILSTTSNVESQTQIKHYLEGNANEGFEDKLFHYILDYTGHMPYSNAILFSALRYISPSKSNVEYAYSE